MSQQDTNCDVQAAGTASVKAIDTLIKTGDPILAATDFCTTYVAAKGVCEIGKGSGGTSTAAEQK